MFLFHTSIALIVLLLYVDDIIITGSSSHFVFYIIRLLPDQFPMKDLGDLYYFLGVQVVRTLDCLFLSQTKYIHDLLHKLQLHNSKPTRTSLPS